MPTKPKRPCGYPGCPNLTDSQYCEEHRIQERRNAFTPAANQAESTATTIAALKDEFNALLSKLKKAGLMKTDEE